MARRQENTTCKNIQQNSQRISCRQTEEENQGVTGKPRCSGKITDKNINISETKVTKYELHALLTAIPFNGSCP